MAEITLDQLGEKAQLFLTDLMAVSDSNGILYGNTLQDFANFFSTASGVDFKDSISAGTYATKDAGWYFATDTGDYIMGATTIAVDVSNTLTIIIVDATIDNSSKVEVPISITIDATPTDGSTNAVQSGGVYTVLIEKLKAEVISEGYAISNIVYSDDNLETADIVWSDSDTGTINNVVVGDNGITSLRLNRSNGDYFTRTFTYDLNGEITSDSVILTEI